MPTPTDLLVFLVTEGCLPMVAGDRPSATAPNGAVLSAAERAALGFASVGVTLRYPADGGGVVADFGADAATLRTEGAEAGAALAALEQAILAGGRDVQRAQDSPLPDSAGRLKRTWFVRVSQQRWAQVTAAVPKSGAPADAALEVTVVGMEAIGQRTAGAN